MDNNHKDLATLKAEFNTGFASNDEDQLLGAFYGLEEYALSKQDYQLLGSVYSLLTTFMHNHEKYDLLIRYSVQYMHYAKSIPDLFEGEDYYAIAGNMAFMMEDYDLALECVTQEIKLQKKRDNPRGVATQMNNMAELQLKTGKVVEALNTAIDARIILQEIGLDNDLWGALNKGIIAKIYVEIGDLSKGKQYLDELLRWPNLDEHPSLKKETYISYARYYMALKDEGSALDYYEEAIDLSETFDLDQEKHILYSEISDAYALYDDYKKSHLYLHKYINHMADAFKKMQTMLKVNTELEVALLEKEAELQKLKVDSKKIDVSKFDPLTGIYTEAYMMGMMDSMLKRNKVTGKCFSLLIMTMPELKKIQALEGLVSKEGLIMTIAGRLLSVKHSRHVIGHLMNDKFMVCMVDEKVEQAKVTAQRYIDVLTTGVDSLVVYGGIVDNSRTEAEEITALVRMADLALYQSEKINKRQLTVW